MRTSNLFTVFALLVGTLAQADGLPAQVFLKTSSQSLTRRHQFALSEGRIYVQNAGAVGQWGALGGTGLPDDASAQEIAAISADGGSLVAVTPAGRVFDAELTDDPNGELKVKWNKGWGWPLRLGAQPLFLPNSNRGFAASLLDAQDGAYYSDPAGNPHLILGINTLYVLDESGQQIRFDDPWLPPNAFQFRFNTPLHGAFKAISVSASGSTVLVIDRTGRMFTRIIDFDTLGGNPGIAYSYSVTHDPGESPDGFWASMRTHLPFLLDLRKLPGDTWHEQTRVRLADGGLARITGRITLLQTGQGNDAREIRVEGVDAAGNTGYFSKPISSEGPWQFRATGAPLTAELLDQTAAPEPANPIGESHGGNADFWDYTYRGGPVRTYSARVDGFNTSFDEATVTLSLDGLEMKLPLYLQADIFPVGDDAWISGAMVLPPEVLHSSHRAVQDLVDDWFQGSSTVRVRVHLTPGSIEIQGNWPQRSSRNSFDIRFSRR